MGNCAKEIRRETYSTDASKTRSMVFAKVQDIFEFP
jgi:hypothetical protein